MKKKPPFGGVDVASGHSILRKALGAGAGIEEGGGRITGRVERPGLRSRMLDTTEAAKRLTRRTSLRQALTRCVCRMEGARAPGA